MRHIRHPGPVAAIRRRTADCRLRHEQVRLPVGRALLPTLATLLDDYQAEGAVLRIAGGQFEPFAFCMPALSPTPEHAVYFSERHQPPGPVQLEIAAVTLGHGESGPWLHCHGIWHDARGRRLGGHVLPNDAVIHEPINAAVTFMNGARFQVVPSPETGFSLFEPVSSPGSESTGSGSFAMSVRPNEDFCLALEEECRERGITRASVCGGVGSLVGASFDDGREVVPFVTEVFIKTGHVALGADRSLVADIEVGLVDHLGGLHEGRLRRGHNPVLVTFELLIEPLELA
jgi:predicted DNA-binding protein with PD1-like motif